ncbi:MAG: CDP-alcohol phosphatidyltransferase family protein [Acidimicrobiia bacterium]|nr:CDP-alcohol phosphatidyltransferase family protein [Acidimicrobiia bacterium]
MFDAPLRRACAPATDGMARLLHRHSVRAAQATAVGFALGLGAAASAAVGWWWPALGLWLASRVVDGIDGAIARIERATARGGFLDLMADFTVYAAFVAGIAVQVPSARLAAVALLCTYYVSGAAFLAWSAATAEQQADRGGRGGLALDDNRSLRFVGGLAEGAETVAVYCLICLLPHRAALILWAFAAMVAVTAVQRVAFAAGDLRPPTGEHRGGGGRPADGT